MNKSARAFLEGFEAALDAVDAGNLHRVIVEALQSIIAEIPAVDVVEVVRCKDCEMWGYTLSEEDRQRCIEFNTDLVCDYWESDGLMPNDFCSKGERKEG